MLEYEKMNENEVIAGSSSSTMPMGKLQSCAQQNMYCDGTLSMQWQQTPIFVEKKMVSFILSTCVNRATSDLSAMNCKYGEATGR